MAKNWKVHRAHRKPNPMEPGVEYVALGVEVTDPARPEEPPWPLEVVVDLALSEGQRNARIQAEIAAHSAERDAFLADEANLASLVGKEGVLS